MAERREDGDGVDDTPTRRAAALEADVVRRLGEGRTDILPNHSHTLPVQRTATETGAAEAASGAPIERAALACAVNIATLSVLSLTSAAAKTRVRSPGVRPIRFDLQADNRCRIIHSAKGSSATVTRTRTSAQALRGSGSTQGRGGEAERVLQSYTAVACKQCA